MRTSSVIGDFSKPTPPRKVSIRSHAYSAPTENNHPSLYWNGKVVENGPAATADVPIRLQFAHSTVARPVHCDVNFWRNPTLTVSGKFSEVLAVADPIPDIASVPSIFWLMPE